MLSQDEQQELLRCAHASIRFGLEHQTFPNVDLERYSVAMRQTAATFVTIKIDDKLRGCIGSLSAELPLVADVTRHAYQAAFSDPRFPAMTEKEVEVINLSIAVLSPNEALTFDSERSLLDQLTAHKHGLIIATGDKRATFLPAVWDSLPAPSDFIAALRTKAGLRTDQPISKAWRYTAHTFCEPQ